MQKRSRAEATPRRGPRGTSHTRSTVATKARRDSKGARAPSPAERRRRRPQRREAKRSRAEVDAEERGAGKLKRNRARRSGRSPRSCTIPRNYRAARERGGDELPRLKLERSRHTLVTATVAPFRAWRGSRASVGRTTKQRLTRRGALLARTLEIRGGGGGIRTLGTFRYTRFPVVHLRPLGHPSGPVQDLRAPSTRPPVESPRASASTHERSSLVEPHDGARVHPLGPRRSLGRSKPSRGATKTQSILCGKNSLESVVRGTLAESVGFEPTVESPLLLISNQTPSTARPALRGRN